MTTLQDKIFPLETRVPELSLEKSISHGIIINTNPDPTIRINGDGQIQYANGNSLIWFRDESDPRSGFIFDYYTSPIPRSKSDKRRRIRLNDIIKYGEWIFVPVESGFYARLTEYGVIKDNPEIQLNIPSLRASELEILAALHEIGHAGFYNDVHNSVSKRQLLDLDGTFAEQVVQVDRLLNRIFADDYQEIEEILAWKNALLADWRFSILGHFTEAEKSAFIRKRLGTYLGVTKALWTN